MLELQYRSCYLQLSTMPTLLEADHSEGKNENFEGIEDNKIVKAEIKAYIPTLNYMCRIFTSAYEIVQSKVPNMH